MTRESRARALALAAGFLMLGGAEAVLRLWSAPFLTDQSGKFMRDVTAILRRDGELFWVQRGNLRKVFFGVPVVTDEFGLRNPAGYIARPGDKDEFRILVLGASSSFGWGVPEELTYPRRLEGLLRAGSSRPVRVMNASVIGYSSWQGLALLKKYLAVFRPDYVIASFAINDACRERFFYSGALPDKDSKARGAGFLNFVNDLALTRAVAALASRFRPRGLPPGGGTVRVSPQDFSDNHEAIVALARQRHADAGFLIIPFHFPALPPANSRAAERLAIMRRMRDYESILHDLSRRDFVDIVDMSAPLGARYSDYFRLDKGDYIHPNIRGHALIAQALARLLLPRLRRPSGPAAGGGRDRRGAPAPRSGL